MTTRLDDSMPLVPRARRGWVAVGLALAAGLLVAHAFVYLDYTVDDAFISFRYGQNLASGHGLVFNPGERVEGYSNLAWTALFGLVSGLASVDGAVLAMKGVAVVLGVASLALVACLALEATGAWAAAVVAALLVAQSPFVAVWLVAGLETPLFALELLAMALFAVRERRLAYCVAAALCCLTRPEGVAMVGAVAFVRTLAGWPQWRARAWLFAPLLAAVAQLGFRLIYYGDWVPNTAHVKLGGGWPQLVQGAAWVLRLFGDWSAWLGLPALVVAAILLWRNELVQLLLALIGGYLAFLVYSGGDFFALYRLGVPILPLMTVVVVAAAWEIARRLPRARPWRELGVGLIAITLLAGFVVVPLHRTEAARTRVKRETGMLYRFSIPAARWLEAHSPPGSRVALTVAGAIPYYSGLHTIDRFGLCDAEIARADVPWQDVRSGISKYDPDSVLRREPEWILLDINDEKLRRNELGRLHPADRALLSRTRFQEEYRLVDDWVGSPVQRLALYVRKGSTAEARVSP